MGSLISRKLRKNKRKVDEANTRAIFFGCHRIRSESLASDSPKTLISSSFSINNNNTSILVTNFTGKKLPNRIGNGNGSVETYSPVEDEFRIDDVMFSSFSCSRSLLSCSIPCMATTTSSGTWQSFEPTPLTQVLPQLYLGNEQDAQQVEKLIGLGITHIISVAGSWRDKDLYPKHMYIPMHDNGSSNLVAKIDKSYDFAMESQEPGNKLFIHCQWGQNRSASFVIGFLMKSKNLSFHEAYTLLKEKRELIHPHKKYIEQLRQLDLELYKVHSTPKNFLDIALCPEGGIKIKHHNFNKVDSENYMTAQKRNLKEDEGDISSLSSLPSQARYCDMVQLSSICIPDIDDSQNISVEQSPIPTTMQSRSN